MKPGEYYDNKTENVFNVMALKTKILLRKRN